LKLWQETSLEVVKGEFEDVFPENKSREQMERIHGSKTGSLFGFCFAAPFAGRKEEKFVQMRQLGLRFGKLFQMMDDIKDVTSTETELGKTPGKDGKQDKLTILSFESLEEAQMKVKEMFLGLLEEIDEFSDLSREMVNVYDLIAKR
jgi:geranylgeranyl diphosphate synthase type II